MKAIPTTFALLSLFLFACGGSSGGSGAGGDGGGGGDGDGDGDCSSAASCSRGQVCHPDTGECVADLACSGHGECGIGGHCAESGVCEANQTGGTCDDDSNCPSGQTCVGGYCGCEGVAAQAEPVTPNILIVLDRSGSMDQSGGGGQSKWDIAVDAVATILSTYGSQVRFGLVLYSSNGNCGAGDVEVEIGDGTAAAINQAIDNADPSGSTPIGATLDNLIGYDGLADQTRPNYVLLLTDGDERCNGDGEQAATDLRAQSPEVKTFVVGFGSGVDEDALSDMAVAGGTALSGDPAYYQADDAQQLNTAFDSIIGSVLACTYSLSGDPTTPDAIHVYFGDDPVDHDPTQTDGWDYDPDSNQITFYGPACNLLQTGTVTDLAIVLGCPADPID